MRVYLLLLFCYGFCLPVSGQVLREKAPKESFGDSIIGPPVMLEMQVISASRRQAVSAKLPYALHVVNLPSESANMPRSTPEALKEVPGVFLQQTNQGGGSPFIRGLTGNQTLILVDGIRVNNSTFRYGPNQYLNTIDPFSIQKVEVLRGSGSVQYGSDAIGGVVQLFTKEPAFTAQQQFSGKLTGRYWNSNMEKTGSAEFNISGPQAAFLGIVGVKDFGDLLGGDTTGLQSPSGYTETDVYLKAKWKITESSELTLSNQFVQQNNVAVFHKVKLENYDLNEMGIQARNLAYIKFSTKSSNPIFQQLNINASLTHSLEERESRKNTSFIATQERDRVNTSNLSAELFSTFTDKWTANTGAELYHDGIRSSRKTINGEDGSEKSLRGLYPDHSSYLNGSVYTLHHLSSGRFNLEAGARYNWLSAALNDIDLGQIAVNPNAFVVNAGTSYHIKNHHVYLSFNSGYRAPNIDDMGTLGIVDFRYELPAYSLKPEKNYNTEAGYKYVTNQWNIGTAIYYNKLSNLITQVQTGQEINGYKVYQKVNNGEAIIRGIEGYIKWNAANRLYFDGFASFNHGQNVTDAEPLRRIPPLNGYFSIKYKLPLMYLKGEVSWADDQTRLAKGDKDDNRIPIGGTPGWKVFNLYSGYNFKPFQLRLSVQNLFDRDYRTHGSGINAVGRSFWISTQFNFSSGKL